jgi:hypothetical protein
VAARAIDVQRIYLDSARRYAESLEAPPAWIARLLDDWQQTLDAMSRDDRPWLAARLDAFTKYELFSAVLAQNGCMWRELPRRTELFHELALLDQSYHEFGNPDSAFSRLDRAGLLRHRVGPFVPPGEEPEPFVPETATRAAARARFIAGHANQKNLMIDWSWVAEGGGIRRCHLFDPFAQEYDPWQNAADPVAAQHREPSLAERWQALAPVILRLYDHGEYEAAYRHMMPFARIQDQNGAPEFPNLLRYRAWVQARRGFVDGPQLLQRLYADRRSMPAIADFCCVYRFQGLQPPAAIDPWLEAGQQLLAEIGPTDPEPGDTQAFREHLAWCLLCRNRGEEARAVLQTAIEPTRMERTYPRIKARIMATLGEAYRVLGCRFRSGRMFRGAQRLQVENEFHGDLADLTLTCQAKWSRRPANALAFLQRAKETQTRLANRPGLARTLLLEARLSGPGTLADQNHVQLLTLRTQAPALMQCQRLTAILDGWDSWTRTDRHPSDGGEGFQGI